MLVDRGVATAVASRGHPGFTAMNVQGFGAGVGKVGPYYEMGNWYRGGAVQMLFIDWLMGEQNQVRPMFPANLSQEELIRVSKSFDLAQRLPPVDWEKAFEHLPTIDLIKNLNGPHGIFADSMPVPTGGAMMKRTPNDPAWYKGGLWHENMPIDIPGLWYMSWYDVSVGPNLAMYNHVRKTAKGAAANQQWAIIAPVGHCAYTRATDHTIVGERDMGDARLGYQDIMYAFFDRFLKGDNSNRMLDTMPKVRYFVMGLNQWKSSDTWPPKGASPMTFHLGSKGNANTLNGDGVLAMTPSKTNTPDKFSYDPMNPVKSHGGNVCCQGNAVLPGSLDQQKAERTAGRAGVHQRAVQGRGRTEWPDHSHLVRVIRREGHRLHGQGSRCVSRRSRLQSRRVHPAHAVSRWIRQAARDDEEGFGVQGHVAATHHQQLFRARSPASHRGVQQQLPALRSQSQHGRQQLG
jgi:predicted acyl esterase